MENGSTRRSLSQSRRHILQILTKQSGGITTTALAKYAGLHENTVRDHLHGLLAAGFVTRVRRQPDGKGRPAWLWSVNDAELRTGYAGLATALAHTLSRALPDPAEAAVKTGIEWGYDIASNLPATSDPRAAIVDLLTQLGYEPESADGNRTVILRACPLLEAATSYPDVVCGVHHGLVKGVLAHYRADGIATELEPFSSPFACTLRLLDAG